MTTVGCDPEVTVVDANTGRAVSPVGSEEVTPDGYTPEEWRERWQLIHHVDPPVTRRFPQEVIHKLQKAKLQTWGYDGGGIEFRPKYSCYPALVVAKLYKTMRLLKEGMPASHMFYAGSYGRAASGGHIHVGGNRKFLKLRPNQGIDSETREVDKVVLGFMVLRVLEDKANCYARTRNGEGHGNPLGYRWRSGTETLEVRSPGATWVADPLAAVASLTLAKLLVTNRHRLPNDYDQDVPYAMPEWTWWLYSQQPEERWTEGIRQAFAFVSEAVPASLLALLRERGEALAEERRTTGMQLVRVKHDDKIPRSVM